LIAYFGYLFFPVLGIFVGGLLNLVVLQTIPLHSTLVGVSGVVNWMGGAWLALSWLVDRRDSAMRRGAKIVAVTIVLFVPDTFRPEISYLSHFLGYFAGMFSALVFYLIFRRKFRREEIVAVKVEMPVPEGEAYWEVNEENHKTSENNEIPKSF